MKKLFLTLSLMTALTTATVADAQRHRHNPQTIEQATVADTAATAAFSDTTSVSAGTGQASADDTKAGNAQIVKDPFENVNDPFSLMGYLPGIGIAGTIVAIFLIILCLLIVCSPFILAGLAIYTLTKRRNRKYEMIERAMEKGYDIPKELMLPEEYTNETMWKKGIKNISIGLGLIFLFGIIGAAPLTGIGCIVLFYGVGQAVISKTVKDNRHGDGRTAHTMHKKTGDGEDETEM